MTNAEARFNKSHIRKVYACLAVTCHLHFWQNDRDFLRATVVTRGWNGYRNKSQHRKSTLEKKIPAGIRTRDLSITSPALYLLSYPRPRIFNGGGTDTEIRVSTESRPWRRKFQQGFEPATFQSRVRRSTYWAIPAPVYSKDELMLNVLRCHLTY